MKFGATAYLKELEQGFCEFRKNMVDFVKQTIGTEQWSPAFKNGVGDLKDTVIDLWIIGSESGDEILKSGTQVNFQIKTWCGLGVSTSIKVSHRSQKSLSAIILIASPSCTWSPGGAVIMSPIISCLTAATSLSAIL